MYFARASTPVSTVVRTWRAKKDFFVFYLSIEISNLRWSMRETVKHAVKDYDFAYKVVNISVEEVLYA